MYDIYKYDIKIIKSWKTVLKFKNVNAKLKKYFICSVLSY